MLHTAPVTRTGLATLVADYHHRRDDGRALLVALHGCVCTYGQRFPDCYFELGRRDDDALQSLTNRVFYSASRVPRGVLPYRGRIPFAAYTEDRYDDRQVRYHTVFGGRSLTRQEMRAEYRKNRVRIPEVGRRFALYAALGELLPRIATRDPGPPERWKIDQRGPSLALSDEDLVRRLRGEGLSDLSALAPRALTLARRPLTRSALTHLLADVLPPVPMEVVVPPDADALQRMRVRAALARAWTGLEPEARRLCGLVAHGLDAKEIGAAEPSFRDPAALSRALRRLSERFLAEVVAEVFGAEAAPDPSVAPTPRTQMELILGVLLEMLPELERENA